MIPKWHLINNCIHERKAKWNIGKRPGQGVGRDGLYSVCQQRSNLDLELPVIHFLLQSQDTMVPIAMVLVFQISKVLNFEQSIQANNEVIQRNMF